MKIWLNFEFDGNVDVIEFVIMNVMKALLHEQKQLDPAESNEGVLKVNWLTQKKTRSNVHVYYASKYRKINELLTYFTARSQKWQTNRIRINNNSFRIDNISQMVFFLLQSYILLSFTYLEIVSVYLNYQYSGIIYLFISADLKYKPLKSYVTFYIPRFYVNLYFSSEQSINVRRWTYIS